MTTRPQSDDRLARLLAATERDAAPPDRATLAALRERSAAEFAAAGEKTVLTHQQQATMFFTRALIALAATAAAILGAMWLGQPAGPPAVAKLTLREVLAKVGEVETFQAILDREDDFSGKVWGRGSRALRIETSPTHYTLIEGENAWEVNESENRVRPVSVVYLSPESHGIDLLRLIDVSAEEVADDRPTDKRVLGGREYFVFQRRLSRKDEYSFEALVDAQTKLPASFRIGMLHNGQFVQRRDLEFVAFAQAPADPVKFQVPATLTEDGRIGKVTDHQGLVSLRPLTSDRWTPICGETILRPGDWLRTDFQGANAVTVQLAPQTKLILGPGSLVEFAKPDQIRLYSGIAEITPSPKADNFSGIVKLTGPAGATMDVGGTILVQANERGLARLPKDPPWLAGYKGSAAKESLGSLIAKIDGREVSLTVGYHKVAVEIRDQIARTTIEESFVNNTDARLEGQFHFPLPADASISGFGMWIGNSLVEADIVEKQRAREIYEIILREKRDPGLLEWTGGNIFKARVFPIEAKSEKRIKIVYTQVLPRKGDSYRYSYALQSDLLRINPLRQLDLEVTVASTQPLAKVESPTHPARGQQTEHAARLEFSAQKYTPTRDFEAVVTLAGQAQDVTFIPHQRGEDGYFLLLLQPPAEGGAWQRDVVPSGAPLNLIVLADTSASMDRSSRKNQAEVIAALLGSLSPKDRFQLAACDVRCVWANNEPQAADKKNVAAARDFLSRRRSLGWTDLSTAFDEALKRATPGMQIVYIGDGVVTNVGATGLALTQRAAASSAGKDVTCHTIAVSSSYDQAVLRGLAAIGGGSMRAVSGTSGPQPTVRDLLAEITRPALRNIQLEFKGLQTARVYPRTLPNVPAGTQQIVLGRYLPQKAASGGEVIVTGMLGGKSVTYRTAVGSGFGVQGSGKASGGRESLEASDDASFIPRLWARMHLDELLAQGSSQQIQDEIIGLSEEFHIITPYTSLLVLESDADRERFKVKKRMLIRDGERFFAAGRDQAQYELVQQQMRAAGLWRVALRQQVLAQLAHLGRNAEALPEKRKLRESLELTSLGDLLDESLSAQNWEDVGGRGAIDSFSGNLGLVASQTQEVHEYFATNGNLSGLASEAGGYKLSEMAPRERDRLERMQDIDAAPIAIELSDFGEQVAPKRRFTDGTDLYAEVFGRTPQFGGFDAEELEKAAKEMKSNALYDFDFKGKFQFAGEEPLQATLMADTAAVTGNSFYGRGVSGRPSRGWMLDPSSPIIPSYHRPGLISAIRNSGLPSFLPIGLGPAPPAAAAEPKPRKSNWPAEAQQISRAIVAAVELAKLEGGLLVENSSDSYDAPRGRLRQQSQWQSLQTAKAWLLRSSGDESDTTLAWASATERGVASLAYDLVLTRKSAPTDFPKTWKLPEWWLHDLEWSYQSHTVEIQRPAKDQVALVLRHILRPHDETRIRIDTAKNAVLSRETYDFGTLTSKLEAKDHVQIAGVWLPQHIEQTDEAGRLISATTRKYTLLAADQFAARMEERLKEQASALRINVPFPTLDKAKAAVAAGRGTLADRLVVLYDLASRQLWPQAITELEAIEKLMAGQRFAPWLRLWVLEHARRHEELRQLANTLAPQLVQPRTGDIVLARRLAAYAANNLQANEVLAILDALKPIYDRQPERTRLQLTWSLLRATQLASAGRTDAELALRRDLAERYPDERDVQANYARTLREGGDYEAAYAWLKAALANPAGKWPVSDRDYLYEVWAGMLRDQGRWAEIAELAAEWTRQLPEDADAYELLYAALVYTNRYEEADRLLTEWFAAGLGAPRLTKTSEPPIYAAIECAQGENSYLHGGDEDPQWYGKLAEVLTTFVGRLDQRSIVSNATGPWRFRNSEPFKAASRQLVARLKTQAATLPLGELEQLFDWVSSYATDVGADDFTAIAAAIRPRWEAATHPSAEETLARMLTTAYTRVGAAERIAFLRLRLEKADDDNRPGRAQQLFEALIEQPWTAEFETESFALLDKIVGGDDATLRLRQQIYHLHRWLDRMEAARNELYEREIKDPEKLKRTELIDKRKENQKRARTELSDKLAAAATARQDGLKPWLQIERLYLEIKLEREPARVAEACFELLGAQPPAPRTAESEPTLAELLDLQFKARLLTMLTWLATQRETQAAVTPRLEKYIDALIAQDADGTKFGLDGRRAKYALLVAQDRPQELLAALAQWAKQVKYPQAWQRDLAHLHAELGQLTEAVALADLLIKEDAWSGSDFRRLALWQQALGQQAKYEAALVSAYEQYQEYQLRQLLERAMQPWQNRNEATPSAIDPQVFLIQKALYQKVSYPHQYVYLTRSFYEASRDFRLLAALADAMSGQSALKVYPFLGEMKHTLDEIDREAAADEMVRHIAKLREQAKRATDQRALDLLEMLAERRAAEVQNQPGPHVQRAIAALMRAEKREWSPGEPKLMAEMLAHLNGISQKPLADEVLRVMTALHAAEKEGTLDRLEIARWLAEALNNNGRSEQAMAVLETAIPEYRRAIGERTTRDLVVPIALLSDLYSGAGQFARAEAVLRAEVPRAVNREVANDFEWRIYGVHNRALERGGTTSLGSGLALYQNLQAELLKAAAATPDHRQRPRLVSELAQFYRKAHDLKIAAAPADVRRFAMELFPPILAKQVNDYQDMVANVHGAVRTVAGPRDALSFLITRIEGEPRWLTKQGDNGWQRFSTTLSELKEELRALGDLEPRLLAIVLKELRRDLETQRSRHRVMYDDSYSHYWQEKRNDFARVAEDVLQKNRQSEAAVLYIAEYLFDGLDLMDRAIEILLDAHRQKLLRDDAQGQLAQYLHRRERWGESIPILEALVERHPEYLGYRMRLMLAYFKSKRPDAMLALLAATDKLFHEGERWQEGAASQLAEGCLDCELFEQTAKYYDEAIARRKEATGGRTTGDQRLAQYHAEQAFAWAGMKNTEKAVEAAGGAIVGWGAAGDVHLRHRGTIKPLDVLREVLKASPNLDAYVAEVDKKAADTQEDSAIIRKAIGEVYFERMEFAKAAAQLKIAVELAPNDAAIHIKLVACYDALKEGNAAAEQLFAAVELTRRDVELWASLANRLQTLGQAEEAERARTSLAEMLPNETEGHAKLAQLRQEANRWDDAILHWREVATLRKLEPAGLLSLAAAELHQKQKAAAGDTLTQLDKTDWPARFHDELREKLLKLREQWRMLP